MFNFKCYGDVNVLEHGSVFVSADLGFPGICYRVLKVIVEGDGAYRLWDTDIDLSDDWIDWAGVESATGINRNDEDQALVACEVLEYYGLSGTPVDEFVFSDEAGLRAELALYGIEI